MSPGAQVTFGPAQLPSQYIYADGVWHRVRRAWLFTSGRWLEVFYSYVRGSGKWRMTFLQNPSWMYNLTVGTTTGSIATYFGYINDDPDPEFENIGSLVVNPGAPAPSSPWRLAAIIIQRQYAYGNDSYKVRIRYRAPKHTSHPGPLALRSVGYVDFLGRDLARTREVWPYANYFWKGDNFGEALMEFHTNLYNYATPEGRDTIRPNFPEFLPDEVVPFGARFLI